MVVGAPADGEENSSQTGSAFVYMEVIEDEWDLLDNKIIPSDGDVGYLFGSSVDINEDSMVAIGSKVCSFFLLKR